MCVTMSVSIRKITKPINNNIFKSTDNKLYKTGTAKKITQNYHKSKLK